MKELNSKIEAQVRQHIGEYRSQGYSDEQIQKALLKSNIDPLTISHLMGNSAQNNFIGSDMKAFYKRLWFVIPSVIILLFVLLFVVFLFTGQDVERERGTLTEDDTDVSEVTIGEVETDVESDGDVFLCDSESDCPEGYNCNDGECTETSSGEAGSSGASGSNESSSSSGGDGGGSSGDSGSSSSSSSSSDSFDSSETSSLGALGDSCSEDGACESGICEESVCVICNDEDDSLCDGYACDTNSFSCLDSCDAHEDCSVDAACVIDDNDNIESDTELIGTCVVCSDSDGGEDYEVLSSYSGVYSYLDLYYYVEGEESCGGSELYERWCVEEDGHTFVGYYQYDCEEVVGENYECQEGVCVLSCESDDACQEGEVCEENICVEESTCNDLDCSDGFVCDFDTDACYDSCSVTGEEACADEYTCSEDGACYLECASYVDCPEDYTCESSACNPSSGDSDEDGVPNEEDDLTEGYDCVIDDECASGLMCGEGGYCTEEEDEGAETEEEEEETEDVCAEYSVPTCSDGVDNDLDGAQDYGGDEDCSSWSADEGTYEELAEVGEACDAHEDCVSGACYPDGASKVCVECSDDGIDCPDGMYCSSEDSYCYTLGAYGDACGSDEECASAWCLLDDTCGCQSNEDCGEGEYCDSENACVLPLEGSLGEFVGDGEDCNESDDSACDTGYSCDTLEEQCFTTCDETTRVGCVEGYACSDGVCAEEICEDSACGEYVCDTSANDCYDTCSEEGNQACADGYACAEDSSCAQDADTNFIADVDQSCSVNSDCSSDLCIDGSCVECADASFCSDGYACDLSTYTCYDSCTEENEDETCYTMGDIMYVCAGDYTCAADEDFDGVADVDEAALSDVGGTCQEGSQCVSGICSDYQICGDCDEDSDCSEGFACNLPFALTCYEECDDEIGCASGYSCIENSCVSSLLEIGEACSSGDDADCASGHCSGYTCTECEADTDCSDGEICDGGVCLLDEGEACDEDSDCVGGLACSNDIAPYVCETDLDGDGWVNSEEKALGESCNSDDDAECLDNHCSGYICTECEADTDCSDGEICDGGECVEEGETYSSCADDGDCDEESRCILRSSSEYYQQCVPCEDSDGGQDYYVVGDITGASYSAPVRYYSYTDTCSGSQIREYYCSTRTSTSYGDHLYVNWETVDCPEGYSCSEGACVSSSVPSAAPSLAPEEEGNLIVRFFKWFIYGLGGVSLAK